MQAHIDASVELRETGSPEEAIARYDEAIRLDPQDAAAYINRGNANDYLGQHQRAIDDYDEAIRLDPRTHLLMCYEHWLTPRSATTKRPSRI